MLHYIYGDSLDQHPTLRDTMFRDRAQQFKVRQGWDVTVDENGFERDEYDAMNPLYVIWEQADGRHGGSMRLLPTTGRCMVNDHFLHLTDGVPIQSPLIWECTRFCLAPDAATHVAGALMLGGGEVMEGFGLAHLLGVFDRTMQRVYRLIGATPTVIGNAGTGRDQISAGLWEVTDADRARVAKRAGIPPALSRQWFERDFFAGHMPAKTA